MIVDELLNGASIAPHVSAADKRQALSVVAEMAARAFGLKAPKVFDALLEREGASPTGVGHGVAIPHCQVAGLDRIRGVFLRLEAPIEFDAVDETPVDLIFALLGPPERGSDQLRALAGLSRLLRGSGLREQLRNARSADAIRALLVRDARPSAA